MQCGVEPACAAVPLNPPPGLGKREELEYRRVLFHATLRYRLHGSPPARINGACIKPVANIQPLPSGAAQSVASMRSE